MGAKCGAAEVIAAKSCILTMRREAHSNVDLEVGELVEEIRRLSIVDPGGGAKKGNAGDAKEEGAISVDEYLKTLEMEREAQLRQEEAEAAAALGADAAGGTTKAVQPEIRKAVDT